MWRKEAIPQKIKDASTIRLYKPKRNHQVCDNHRGISLLSIVGEIQTKILLNRLNALFYQKGLIPESQCGLRTDRGTIDMIFTASQFQKKCQEQNVDLYMTFVDLTKAFDTVCQDGRLKIMAKLSCLPRFIAMDKKLKVVDKFAYLGSTHSRAVHIDDEVTARMTNVSMAFGRFCANIWKRNGIKLDTKLKVSIRLWYCQPSCMHVRSVVYQRHAKRLHRLRKLLYIKRQGKIPDPEVLKKAG